MIGKRTTPLTGHEVWMMPEFVAFCKAIGVAYELPGTKLTIEVGKADELVKITQEYQARPGFAEEKRLELETTNQHNAHLRTFRAPSVPDEPKVVRAAS